MGKENNIAKLVDAICDNFMKAIKGGPWAPKFDENNQMTTFCNMFIDAVAKQSNGYERFWPADRKEPMMANEIYDFVSSSADWMEEIDGHMAQFHASRGALVLAVWKNPDGHGHVCVIRPGEMIRSANWKEFAPRCANVGTSVFIDKGVNYAFKNKPEYYLLKSSLPEIV